MLKCFTRGFSFRMLIMVYLAASFTDAGLAQDRNYQEKDLSGRDFRGEVLDGTDFTGATLRGADFTGATLRGAIFKDAYLLLARFDKADLTGADLRGATLGLLGLDGANFSRANLEGVDFKSQSGVHVSFRNANLKGTRNFRACSACDFRGADLRGANLLAMTEHHPETVFTGAVYDNATRWPRWFEADRHGVKRVD